MERKNNTLDMKAKGRSLEFDFEIPIFEPKHQSKSKKPGERAIDNLNQNEDFPYIPPLQCCLGTQ
ncbi:MAG: hypothetical protein HPZ79_07325 [Oscillospiraceae bacterium]|nr:hypothetical protein [Oscillospiraceae bacterium]